MIKIKSKKIASFFMASAILIILALSGCTDSRQTASGDTPSVVKKEGWTEVGKNIYVFTGEFYMVNMVLVTSGKDAALIDAGMYIGEYKRVQDFIKERRLKLRNIIITHMHGDHTGSLPQLKEDNLVPITPENAEDNQEIKLGKGKLRIIFTEGHYMPGGHISVEVLDDNVLIAGDVICNNIIPPIAAGGDVNDLLKTLKTLEEKNYSVIVPGHGEVVDNKLIFERQYKYLNNAKNRVEEVISKGGTSSDLSSIKLGDCIKDTSYLYKERLDYWHQESIKVIYEQLKK